MVRRIDPQKEVIIGYKVQVPYLLHSTYNLDTSQVQDDTFLFQFLDFHKHSVVYVNDLIP